jgi:hypothetical protein
VECCGNVSGRFGLVASTGKVSGLLGTAVILDCFAVTAVILISTGSFGLRIGVRPALRVGIGMADDILGLCGAVVGLVVGLVVMGDLSCPPRGEADFSSSKGNLMGPNGETPSWSLSHDPNVGALGGLFGFHGTVVLLTIDLRNSSFLLVPVIGGFSSIAPLGNNANVDCEPLIGSRPRLPLYAACEGTAAFSLCSATGNFGGSAKYTFPNDGSPRFLLADFLCLETRKKIKIVTRAEAIMLPTIARAA